MINVGFTDFLLAGLAIALVWAAVVDVKTFTISNRLNAAIALAAPLYWWSIGLPVWPDAAIQVAAAAGVFVLLAITFTIGMMGGGDVKLAAALALWFSPMSTVKFLVVMSIAGGLLTLVVMVAHKKFPGWQVDDDGKPRSRAQVPYGVAITIGGLWILAQRFLNHFA
jgi:prepilin peptidase CpaA